MLLLTIGSMRANKKLFAKNCIVTRKKRISFEMNAFSTFEILPDEILLKICRYLRIAGVLYSFYNLNHRLNVTITGYCRHLDLCGMTYQQYNSIVSNILPQLAPFVQSFAFNYFRDRLWSTQAIALFNTPQISFVFPRIRKITLYDFTSEELSSFMNKLHNLPDLRELVIRDIVGDVDKTLLDVLFTANNHHINSIIFEPFTTAFEVLEFKHSYTYENIQKLVINLKSNQQLRQILAVIPNIQYLYVTIYKHDDDIRTDQPFIYAPSLLYITDFRLSSVEYCELNEIHSIVQNMPSLQTLLLDLSTIDEKFINQEYFLANLPRSLQQIYFIIRYTFSEINFEIDSLISSWAASFPVSCFVSENGNYLYLFTNSLGIKLLDLPVSIGKQISQTCQFVQSVNDLFISDTTSLTDILSTLKHFSRVRKLEIKATCLPELCTIAINPPIPLSLIYLQQLRVSGICGLFDILKAAPNLDCLSIDFDCLSILVGDEPTRNLLQQRITRLKIRSQEDIEFYAFQRAVHVFDRLYFLCVSINDAKASVQESLSVILAALNIKQMITIFFNRKNMDKNSVDRQWIIDHSALTVNDEFIVDITDDWFSLWK